MKNVAFRLVQAFVAVTPLIVAGVLYSFIDPSTAWERMATVGLLLLPTGFASFFTVLMAVAMEEM